MTRSEAIRKAIDIVVYLEAHFAKSQKAKKDAEEIIEVLELISEEQRDEEQGDKEVNMSMSTDQLIEIAEKFNKWLNETSDEYQIGKDDLQGIIKSFLIG